MDPLDDLLADLAGGTTSPPANPVGPRSNPPAQPPANPPPSAPAKSPANQGSIDSLLQQIGGTQPIGLPAPLPPAPIPSAPILPPISPRSTTTPIPALRPSPADRKNLLGDIRNQYSAADQAEIESQRQAKVWSAQLWLDDLDPESGEALWFEQFAEGYSSRVEAAIELLAAEQT